MIKILAAFTLVMLVITMACGLLIRYGGDSFRDAGGGHMVLGMITLLSMLLLTIAVFRQ